MGALARPGGVGALGLRADQALAEKLKACEKVREVIALGKESGFSFIEDALYPPNEPQFHEEQLSVKMAKALLRA